ncbi:MAG: AAA family ATPase [Lachnospiraceae bacterium]|nr:AAA family ATPase [Lachnospiraceae bacterium]
MQRIGMGYEFYKRFVDEKLYYVDKTLLIRDVVEQGGTVTLFTRPRRFGKTLALTTLQTFFELEYDYDGNVVDNARYFTGKKIMEASPEILAMQGQYPVLFMTLKSAKQPNFKNAFYQLRNVIASEVDRHRYLLESEKLNDEDKDKIRTWLAATLHSYSYDEEGDRELEKDIGAFATAIGDLCKLLKKHHDKNVIILIDEYDVPLENAYYAGFYRQMVGFIRSMFESALKTNTALERAIITGCLRISKESIFTGLNNLVINSVRGTGFSEGFGFTQEETEAMLAAYGLSEKTEEVRKWYNGYLFGNTEIYNPWSVTHYVYSKVIDGMQFPEPYWANTSGNAIIKDLVEQADEETKEELEKLIAGGTIEKRIHEDITYDDIYQSRENLWNFLFFTGYMRKVSEREDGDDVYVAMRIPNLEIKSIYRNQIRNWFEGIVRRTSRQDLYAAILQKDADTIGDILTDILGKTISTFDSSEFFYHGFLHSMLTEMPRYRARSNREAGDGRPDIVLYPNRPRDPAYIFEVKTRKKFSEMNDGLLEAYRQIEDKKYEEGILDEGYAGAISFGICFCKKACIAGVKA